MGFAIENPPRYTLKDYRQWEGDWELIGGYPYAMSPSPYSQHQLMASSFEFAFQIALKENQKGCNCKIYRELDWIIQEDTVVCPDISIVCTQVTKKGFITHPPQLIVEVFSESTRMKDRNLKFRLYESAGVKYYLMADPDSKSIEIFELVDNQYKEIDSAQSFTLHKGCVLTLDIDDILAD